MMKHSDLPLLESERIPQGKSRQKYLDRPCGSLTVLMHALSEKRSKNAAAQQQTEAAAQLEMSWRTYWKI